MRVMVLDLHKPRRGLTGKLHGKLGRTVARIPVGHNEVRLRVEQASIQPQRLPPRVLVLQLVEVAEMLRQQRVAVARQAERGL